MSPRRSRACCAANMASLPAPVNEEVRRKVIGDAKVITNRPADDIPPELEKYREEIGDYIPAGRGRTLSYALFPQVAKKFFQYRDAAQKGLDSTMFNKSDMTHPV